MPRQLAEATILRFPSRGNRTPRLATETLGALRGLARDLFGTYRPERHYMRGRGPAWHAKHGHEVTTAAITSAGVTATVTLAV